MTYVTGGLPYASPPRNPSGIVQPRQAKAGRRWQGIVQYPDPDKPGAWKQRAQTFERKAEAQAWVDKALTEHRSQPNYTPPSDELFGSYLERWLENASVARRRLQERRLRVAAQGATRAGASPRLHVARTRQGQPLQRL